ncbi:MAG: hypothetical protein R2800_09990 [Flavipsychrobacter sp.]
MSKKKKDRTLEELVKNYPLEENLKTYYVKYPVYKDGLWYGANVLLPTGYDIPFNARVFTTKDDCKASCDMHNKFHWWTKKEALMIVSHSMSNQEKH